MITPEGLNGYRKEAQNIIKYGHKCASMDNPTVIGESMVHLLDVIDRLTAELDQVKYDRSVKHDMAAEQIDELTKELDRYKQGVEIIATCQGQNFNADYTTGIRFDLFNECIPDFVGQRVRVLVMKEEG